VEKVYTGGGGGSAVVGEEVEGESIALHVDTHTGIICALQSTVLTAGCSYSLISAGFTNLKQCIIPSGQYFGSKPLGMQPS
jgi:hypothetical protein